MLEMSTELWLEAMLSAYTEKSFKYSAHDV